MATLYYWEWNKDGCGHLSLELDDGTYISHWPKDGAKLYSFLRERGKQEPTLEHDEKNEGRRADKTLQIPKEFIKNVESLKAWWEDKKKNGTWYNGLYSNCAQFVLAALKQGGLEYAIYNDPIIIGIGSYRAGLHPRRTTTPYDVFSLVDDRITGRWPAKRPHLSLNNN